jgi:DNA polymerase III delta subunit
MAAATPASVRQQIARRQPDPVYLLIGDDETEMARLAADMTALVEDGLSVFNVDRLYATDKGVTASAIAESARTLPVMADRRIVVVLRAERLLKPRRRGKGDDDPPEDEATETPGDADVLEAYVRNPEPQTTLTLVAADADRTRRLYKALQKHATIVECYGLRGTRDARVDLRQVARQAEQLVRKAVVEAGQQIDPAAARLVGERAGTDIAQLRGDVERLLLYAAGKPKISMEDVLEVVSAESAQDDWAVTSAIQRGDVAEALRQLGLAMEGGGVAYKILGQIAWFVRERLAAADPRRVPDAVDALLRTDIDLKSSGGDPRVLLERLVVELCGGVRVPAKPER